MPTALTYPGVYVEELPGGARPIAGVATSTTAFVGFFPEGPTDRPRMVSSFADFARHYGGLDSRSEASYQVRQYFINGGQRAVLLRVAGATDEAELGAASTQLRETADPTSDVILTVNAINPGEWGRQVQVAVEHVPGSTSDFNLVVRRVREVDGQNRVVATEVHLNLSMQEDAARYAVITVNAASQMIQLQDGETDAGADNRPRPHQNGTGLATAAELNRLTTPPPSPFAALVGGGDGTIPTSANIEAALPRLDLLAPDIFNMLCIPLMANLTNGDFATLVGRANGFCRERRAFLLIDPNVADTMTAMLGFDMSVGERNNAVYFPKLRVSDPLADGSPRVIPPSGTMAGIYARTDTERGIWKAPAGTDARIRGAQVNGDPLTEADSGQLNPRGINAFRSLPAIGTVVWGARTGDGADQRASEWKYVPVRRTALFIEESLAQGLQWVVFEPNDEPLWAQIRLNVGGFMQTLFRKGAFQGSTPREAYLVRCDSTTTTQADIDNGIVNILVGFAPLKPAEFVVIQLQQLAGQAES